MKISIISPGGVTNFGERAILIGTIEHLLSKYTKPSITIFGYQNIGEVDEYIAKYFHKNKIITQPALFTSKQSSIANKTKLIGSFFWPRLFLSKKEYKILSSADLIISKGQETLTNYYGMVHYIDSILETYICSKVNPQVVLLGHSIGPIQSRLEEFIAKFSLTKVKKIYTRDNLSSQVLDRIGYTNYERTQDLAFSCLKLLKSSKKASKQKRILIFPNKAIYKSEEQEKIYIDNISKIINYYKKQKYTIELASSVKATDWNDDSSLCHTIRQNHKEVSIARFDNLQEFVQKIQHSSIVVSSRLHPIIIATGLSVKVLALSNAPKVIGILNDTQTKHIITEPFERISIKKLGLHEIE